MRSAALRNPGVQATLASALLFGAGTPLAKLLLSADVSPVLLAGLLYTGYGVGLGVYRLVRRPGRVRISRGELPALAGAIFFGGLAGPVLLMLRLAHMPATGASLLLHAEGAFTAALAWFVFKENVDRRIAVGMVAIVAGAAVLSGASFASVWPAVAILAACLCWGLDNNLTRTVSLNDATWLAAVKGGVAGPVNLVIAFAFGATLPGLLHIGAAALVGLFAYGISLTLFIVGMRHVGTARASAYYSIAPFFGAILAVLLGEPLTWTLIVAAVLMVVGAWLHLTERHEHEHTHEPITHDHSHVRDEHRQHAHAPGQEVPDGVHHTHPHYPDAHHRHRHPKRV